MYTDSLLILCSHSQVPLKESFAESSALCVLRVAGAGARNFVVC